MAILKGDLKFTGSIGNLSFIQEKGTGRIIVRQKGGPSRKKIQKDPSFAVVRKNNIEFGCCSKAGKAIRIAFGPLEGFTSQNFTGFLNARVKDIMQNDLDHPHGERTIYFSKYGKALNGFYLNRSKPLDMIVQTPVTFTVNRDERKAIVYLPTVDPKFHLVNEYKYPFFRFAVSLGVISDFEFSNERKEYIQLNQGRNHRSHIYAEWQSATKPCSGKILEISINRTSMLNEYETLVLAGGIEFGNPDTNNMVQPKKYSGSAKILAMF